MNGVGGQLDFGGTAFDGLAFLEGERVETTLNLLGETEDAKDEVASKTPRRQRKWRKDPSNANTDLLVLTDRRLIHLVYNSSERETAFVSLPAISAVRMDAQRPGRAGGYVWGGISLLAAALLWAVWDQPVLDVVAAGAVALMGFYILLDYVMAPHTVQMTISAGLSQMTMGVHGSISTQRMNDFANRVFEAKANAQYRDVGESPPDTAGEDDAYGHGEETPGASHAHGQEEALDGSPQSEDVVPDDTHRDEDVVAPDESPQSEDVAAQDDTHQGEDVAAPDDTHQDEDVAAPDDSPRTEDVAAPDDTHQDEDVVPDDTHQDEDVVAPDDSSEPLGSDRVESGESITRRDDESSPAAGSSGQS